tara:strand:+ start:783 stop:1283 length:501 start_codon:yes stop_codon:yes gene_type:complete
MVKKRRSYTEEDKEEAFILFSQGYSYGEVATAMNHNYHYSLNKSSIYRWAVKGGWKDRKEKIMVDVRNDTQQRATETITRAISMGKGVQATFIKQLKEGMDIRPGDAYAWTQLLLKLEDALEARDLLIDEVAGMVKDAMDNAGIDEKDQARFARQYSEMLKRMRGQ